MGACGVDNLVVTRPLPTASRTLTAIGLALLAIALAPSHAKAQGLTLGFNSNPALTGSLAEGNTFLVDHAAAAGAGVVRVNLWWSSVAPARRRRRFAPANPASSGYRWGAVDSLVKGLASSGLKVMINITFAPRWAEGRGRPRGAAPGTWRPDPAQFALFAKAAARRYDGTFSDPAGDGVPLPRVQYWQAWNEPNLDAYLTPQWTRTGHVIIGASPVIYRQLLNGFYAAVKGVSRSNVVVSAGIAPYGNPWGLSIPGRGTRMQPLTFDRLLFTAAVHADVVAQHLYPFRGPLWHAAVPGDLAVPDVYRVARMVGNAVRSGKLLPRGPKPVWITELNWNSDPPDAGAVPLADQARWYEQALYELWRQRVDTVLLLQLIDPDMGPWEGGVYLGNGQPKPAATAFRFPFVTERSSRGTVTAWGRAPAAGQLVLEQRSAGRWRALVTLRVGLQQVFVRRLALRGRLILRARVGAQTSLTWTQPA